MQKKSEENMQFLLPVALRGVNAAGGHGFDLAVYLPEVLDIEIFYTPPVNFYFPAADLICYNNNRFKTEHY